MPLSTTGDCRIAFADNDQAIVIGDSKTTIVINTNDAKSEIIERPFGTLLPVTNPVNSSLVAVFAPTGALRLLDLKNPAAWSNDGFQYLDIAINSRNSPISAAWTADGKRLFVVFDNGKIARLDWDGIALRNLVWSIAIDALKIQEQDRPWRHMDLRINTIGTMDKLEIAIRQPQANSKSSGSTSIIAVQWSNNDPQPTSIDSRNIEQTQWLGKNSSSPINNTFLFDIPELSKDPFAIVSDSDSNILIVDGSGSLVIRKMDASKSTWAMGRTNCRQVSWNASGNRWLTLHDNGIALLCDIAANGDARWTSLKHNLGTPLQGELSPDGNSIVFSSGSYPPTIQVYRIQEDHELQLEFSREYIVFAKWHPTKKSLVTINTQNQIESIDNQWKVTSVASDSLKKHLDQDSSLTKFVFFRESWSTPTKANWHMAVQLDSKNSSKLCFVSLSGTDLDFAPMELKNRISSIASSTKENVFAIGDVQGNLSIWFAAPSIDRAPRELFTLPGHRGSSIDALQFTNDGKSLFSSDGSRQNIFWMSKN